MSDVRTERIEHEDGETRCRSHLARPARGKGRRPGVLVFPTWKGLEGFARAQTEALARLGYVGLGVDIYGEGRVATSDDEARAAMHTLTEDRALLRARGRSALEALAAQPDVDGGRLGAVGFCFGGLAALELGRSGADVKAVVSFHGFLHTPCPAEPGQVRARILVHHGDEDPLLGEGEVDAFRREMRSAAVDWTLVVHGAAMHGFMNPAADAPDRGVKYGATAARRAREMTEGFLRDVFGA